MHISTKRIKYLGINLPKETKELYTENYKTLMKEIKDDMNRKQKRKRNKRNSGLKRRCNTLTVCR